MTGTERKKVKYKTVSLPRPLADDIQKLLNEFGYWPSLGAFVREAALEKMKRERSTFGGFVLTPDHLASGDYDGLVCLRVAMICRGKGETSMARKLEGWAKGQGL